jgi:hypothetical protein
VENLGLLNTLINTSFSGQDPNLGLEEKAIYKQLYLYNYYNKQARNVLRGIISTTSNDNLIMVADGDNKIQFANKSEVGKTYKDIAKDNKATLDNLVAKYNIYNARPLQVGGIEDVSSRDYYDAGEVNQEVHNELDEPHENDILDGGEDNV